jgi:hypothetical protein
MDIKSEREVQNRNWGDQPNLEMELNPRSVSSEEYLQGQVQYYTDGTIQILPNGGYSMQNVESKSSIIIPQNSRFKTHDDLMLDYDDSLTCGRILYYGIGFLLLIYVIVMTACMLYFGINYNYCQDMFSIWLIIGGVLCCIDILLLGIRSVLKKRFDTDWLTREFTGESRPRIIRNSTSVFLVFLLLTFVWWMVGFMRIAIGANYSELVETDSACFSNIRNFPFWMILSSSILFWPGLCVCIYYYVEIDSF